MLNARNYRGIINQNAPFKRWTWGHPFRFYHQQQRPAYVHPLSDAVLDTLAAIAPPWWDSSSIAWHEREGTFRVDFTLKGTAENLGDGKGRLETVYDTERRNHFLLVRYGELQGRVSLSDNSKSAWQSNIGDDLARIPPTIREMVTRIDEVSRGIYSLSAAREEHAAPPAVFPFPDYVRSPEG